MAARLHPLLGQRLFGGGEIHGDLSPNAFLNVATALDAWTDDPDTSNTENTADEHAPAPGAMLCRLHHRLLHHHGWQVKVEAGHWVAVDPHGTRWTGRPRGDPPTSTGGSPDRPTAKTPG